MNITLIGSADSSGYSTEAEQMAVEVGLEVARRQHVLVYGPEPECNSLSATAAKAAKEAGGLTIAIAIGNARTGFYDPSAASVVIYTDAAGGAGREVVLVNSAHAVISVGGGSGTLTEIAIAYMNFCPVIAMKGSGGWSDELIGRYLDARKKFTIQGASSAKEAVDLAEELYERYRDQPSQYEKQAKRILEHRLSE